MEEKCQTVGVAMFLCSVVAPTPLFRQAVAKFWTRLLPGRRNSHNGNTLIFADTIDRRQWREIFSAFLPDARKCELQVINHTSHPFLLCWIGGDGKLFHYRRVNDSSINDGSVKCSHTEYTLSGHAFVLLTCASRTVVLPEYLADVSPSDIVCVYRLDNNITQRHILNVQSTPNGFAVETSYVNIAAVASCPLQECAKKNYETSTICGFRVCSEPGLLLARHDLTQRLHEDLEQVYLSV